MNRNLNGELLSRDELVELSFAQRADGSVGMEQSAFSSDMKTSVFWEASRQVRFEMFWRGELVLNTRPVERPAKRVEVDWGVVNFLRRAS